ncbi:hypothetical protein G6F63_016325 [Rhizopus arrhizus]|nr:hypothetical protein G6F63_016325 [Rhizopus arrhizus]
MEGGGNGSTREDFDAVGAYAFSDGAAASRQARLQAQARDAHSRRWQGHAGPGRYTAGAAAGRGRPCRHQQPAHRPASQP